MKFWGVRKYTKEAEKRRRRIYKGVLGVVRIEGKMYVIVRETILSHSGNRPSGNEKRRVGKENLNRSVQRGEWRLP